jgi:(1->4)-alpha-D-glucan 1-alpha-D-glucosylmutase
VPDIYQGDELAFRAFVDPDNRRPVDWERRRRALGALRAGDPDPPDRKLEITAALLSLRALRPQAFAGDYEPLDAGPQTCAFIRGGEVLVVVHTRPDPPPRAPSPPAGDWRDVVKGDGIAVLERH